MYCEATSTEIWVNFPKWQNFQLKHIFWIIKQLSGGETSWSKMLGGETSWSETYGSETSRSKMPHGETSWVGNVQVQKVRGRKDLLQNLRGKTFRSKISRGKRPVPKRHGAKRPGPKMSETSGSETYRSRKSGGETSWSKMSEGETSRSKMSGGETPWSKMSGVKRPDPKCQGAKRPVQKVRRRNVLVRNIWVRKVRVRKHFLSLHFMIVKLPFWLWHSLRLLYHCEVLLFLSFKFDLWFVNWFDLIRGNMILLIKKTFIWKWYFNSYKLPSPWPWPTGHEWGWGWCWENLWTHTYHQTIYESDPSNGIEIIRCSYKVPKSVTHDVTRERKPGAVARSEKCPLGMEFDPHVRHILPWRFGHWIISTAIFVLFRWFKKSSYQVLAKECAPSTGKLPRRLAQEQCGKVTDRARNDLKCVEGP